MDDYLEGNNYFPDENDEVIIYKRGKVEEKLYAELKKAVKLQQDLKKAVRIQKTEVMIKDNELKLRKKAVKLQQEVVKECLKKIDAETFFKRDSNPFINNNAQEEDWGQNDEDSDDCEDDDDRVLEVNPFKPYINKNSI